MVKSKPNEGTSFQVYLPLADSGSGPRQPLQELEDIDALKGNERILLVDDEAYIADFGRRALQFFGYDVTIRTASIEALELFRNKPDTFDLLITDQMMPNMTA